MKNDTIPCHHKDCPEKFHPIGTDFCPNTGNPLFERKFDQKNKFQSFLIKFLICLTAILSIVIVLLLKNCDLKNILDKIPYHRQLTSPLKSKFYNNTLETTFILIKPSEFEMGSPDHENGRNIDEIQKRISIQQHFYIMATEITQKQWYKLMGTKPWQGKNYTIEGDNYPATNISWNDCQEFIDKLNQKENTKKYRLPLEAEWEFVCRAGTITRFNWGEKIDCSKANFGNGLLEDKCNDNNTGQIKDVTSYAPNKWGIYNMHGNVWEWCNENYLNPKTNEKTSYKITRGGGWHSNPNLCRSANRGKCRPEQRLNDQGFRLISEI